MFVGFGDLQQYLDLLKVAFGERQNPGNRFPKFTGHQFHAFGQRFMPLGEPVQSVSELVQPFIDSHASSVGPLRPR